MRRIVLLLIIAIAAGVICGCAANAKKKREALQAEEQRRQQQTNANLAVVASDVKNAEESVDRVIASLGENPPDVNAAKNHAKSAKGSLGKAIPGIRIADADAAQTKKDYWAQRKRADAAEEDRDKSLRWWMTFFFVLGCGMGIVGLLASAIAPRIPGVSILAAGGDVAVVGVAVAVSALAMRLSYSAMLPYAWIPGLTAALAISGTIVWLMFKNIRRMKMKKALVEVIATGEAVKARPDVPNEAIAEEAARIQSDATTKLVQEFKAKAMISEAADVAAAKLADQTGGSPVAASG